MPNIIFVNEDDQVIGSGTKAEALTKGLIHRIVRIFIFNAKGDLLIQKRATNVDVPNRWDQSAAGHVDEGEDYLIAAKRECQEEVGIQGLPLTELGKYYSDESDKTGIRKRFNVLYSTQYEGEIKFSKDEVSEIQWVQPVRLEQWMQEKPEDFTPGFLQSFRYFQTKASN